MIKVFLNRKLTIKEFVELYTLRIFSNITFFEADENLLICRGKI
jgi:hypothetical protein